MSICKMTLVNITGDLKSLDQVLLKCSEKGNFHPELLSQFADKVNGFAPLTEENPYATLLNKIHDIGVNAGIDLEHIVKSKLQLNHQEADDFLRSFQKDILDYNEKRRAVADAVQQHENVLVQLEHLESLDISLDDIFSCQYLKVRFGRLPLDSLPKLEYYQDNLFIFVPFDKDDLYSWCVYFTTQDAAPEVDNIFASLYFERIRIPEYVHGVPGFAKQSIENQLKEERQQLNEVNVQLNNLVQQNKERFLYIYSWVQSLNDTFDMRKYVMAYRGAQTQTFHITGFVPQKEEKDFAEGLSMIDGVNVELLPPDSDKRLTPPTKLKNNRFAKPFEMFVEMYGLPGYNDIDPTSFFAITYTLLFGLMFGDLGQGLVIVLLGWLMWKWKKMTLGRIMMRIGVSSAVFGFLYGSVFGMENLLDPFYINVLGLEGKPIHVMANETTNMILIGAIAIGAVIIVMSMLFNIILGFKSKNYERAIFSNNGIAGLIFYGFVLVAAALTFTTDINLLTAPFIIIFIAVPLLVIFLKEPLGKLAKGCKDIKPHDGIGSFIIESFFEMFEVLLSFVTNTMSFLRVGGFILSHAGMMLVVMTLTEMIGGSGSILVLIIGNLFVMGMEGLIVGIQVLRLEFYEMFSRYYDGEGKPFVPIAAPDAAE